MTKRIQISVIIPTKNRNTYLRECLRSIFEQSHKSNEVIIVDNSVKGLARRICKEHPLLPIRYIQVTSDNLSHVRNIGISMARGKYIFCIDDDCIAEITWIESYLKIFKSERAEIIADSIKHVFHKNAVSIAHEYFIELLYSPYHSSAARLISTANFAFDRTVLDSVYFDETLKFTHEDIDLTRRVRILNLNLIFINKKLVSHNDISTIQSYLRWAIFCGRGFYYFSLKWNSLDKLKKQKTTKKQYIQFIATTINSRKIIRKDILDDKSILTKVFFTILVFIQQICIKAGYIYESTISILANVEKDSAK